MNRKIENLLKLLPQDEKSVIAVAGKMASGKNYICSQLEDAGYKSIDADKLVHSAISQASETIYQTFKTEAQENNINLLNSDNTINRRELGRLVFSNTELLAKQEQIVYPIITDMIKNFIAENNKVIINATVLYKTPQLLELCQLIVFVQANTIKRFVRAKKRDKMSSKQIFNRFYAQKNLYRLYKNTGKQIIKINN